MNPTACPVVCPLPTRTINPSTPPLGYYDVLKRQVRFLLPSGHRNKESSIWRRRPRPPCQAPPPHTSARFSELQTKLGALNGSILSAAWDTACTSHAGMIGDPFIPTGQKSTKIFVLADGHPTPATTIAKLEHNVREPARTVNTVPESPSN